MIKVGEKLYIITEDNCEFKVNDYVSVKMKGMKLNGIIKEIHSKYIIIEDDDFENKIIYVDNIVDIHDLFC